MIKSTEKLHNFVFNPDNTLLLLLLHLHLVEGLGDEEHKSLFSTQLGKNNKH
jgi:hypothetical protein